MCRSCRQLIGAVFFFTAISGSGNIYAKTGSDSTSIHKPQTNRTFIIRTAITDLNEFKKLVKQAEVLKPYGTVQINIATLMDKSFYEIPKGGNPWNEYASNNTPLYKFFPDVKMKPFVPADFIKRNQQLLISKAKILKDNGMEAAFFANEPGFLPSAFFDTYPQLRGPRVDHPRRSNVAFFSPCVSVKETQEMYINMMAELLRTVPEIKTFFFKTNDAGGGFCWSDWLYSGPNGPSWCKNESTGERVKTLMTALQDGAKKAGKNITVYLTRDDGTNFSEEEKKDIDNNLPPDCYFIGRSSPGIARVENFLGSYYPVKGIIDPVSVLQNIQSINEKSAQTIFIGFDAAYHRANESADNAGLILAMLARELKRATANEKISIQQALMQYCEEWAGKNSAEQLFHALNELEAAQQYKGDSLSRITGIYWGVSTRLINRPLVIAPQRLKENEESYFLPYVFNVSKQEAQMDYTDIHGAHNAIPDGVVEKYVTKLIQVSQLLEKIEASAPQRQLIKNMAIALRIYASVMRSCGNFAEAQAIRDRNATKLNGPVHRPNKDVTWTGDPDFIRFNEVMRDELDNAQELIELLQNGGMNLVCHAKDSLHEDTFLLGP
ncbi:MAG: hypothetical protein JSS70_14405, partial [Bacteroidetes bacterium]|nr:hypothetical protein [Bacteroidota bacterium]